MKKYLLIKLFIIFAFNGYTQKIKTIEIDKFTKQKRVETNATPIYGSIMSMTPNRVTIKYRSVADSYFLIIAGYNTAAGVIGTDDRAILLLENDITLTINSTGIQSYDIVGTSSVKAYEHQYHLKLTDIEALSKYKVKSLRVTYNNNNYEDLDVKKSFAEDLQTLSLVFIKEVIK